jgi:hypothetical protein
MKRFLKIFLVLALCISPAMPLVAGQSTVGKPASAQIRQFIVAVLKEKNIQATDTEVERLAQRYASSDHNQAFSFMSRGKNDRAVRESAGRLLNTLLNVEGGWWRDRQQQSTPQGRISSPPVQHGSKAKELADWVRPASEPKASAPRIPSGMSSYDLARLTLANNAGISRTAMFGLAAIACVSAYGLWRWKEKTLRKSFERLKQRYRYWWIDRVPVIR